MATDADFELTFDTAPLDELDQFALLACQKYNFGNSTDWFGTFRGGLHGLHARIYGVKTHYQLVHSWIARLRLPTETEYHVASIFFNMDSAIECFVFMLNALGYAAMPDKFRNVTNPRSLRAVNLLDILGKLDGTTPDPQKAGYAAVFATLQSHWWATRDLMSTIIDQHDASKHRHTIYTGGRLRPDPPDGFFERLDVRDDPTAKSLLCPHAEILLGNAPKDPKVNRKPIAFEERVVMEDIVDSFRAFINRSCVLARDDARRNIKLDYDEFQKM